MAVERCATTVAPRFLGCDAPAARPDRRRSYWRLTMYIGLGTLVLIVILILLLG